MAQMLPRTTERSLVATLLLGIFAITGCEEPQQRTVENARRSGAELVAEEPTDAAFSFPLYSTLPGKMARMEELLNGIERFLGDASFQKRLVADSNEFYGLLDQCRGMYPERLSIQDRPKFDKAIDETATNARKLIECIEKGDFASARDVLLRLGNQRQDAHSQFSY